MKNRKSLTNHVSQLFQQLTYMVRKQGSYFFWWIWYWYADRL